MQKQNVNKKLSKGPVKSQNFHPIKDKTLFFFKSIKKTQRSGWNGIALKGNGKNIRFFFRNNLLVLHIACIAKYIEARKRNNKTCER